MALGNPIHSLCLACIEHIPIELVDNRILNTERLYLSSQHIKIAKSWALGLSQLTTDAQRTNRCSQGPFHNHIVRFSGEC